TEHPRAQEGEHQADREDRDPRSFREGADRDERVAPLGDAVHQGDALQDKGEHEDDQVEYGDDLSVENRRGDGHAVKLMLPAPGRRDMSHPGPVTFPRYGR